MDLIRFDRTDHHPVTFAFVADRNFPDSDFHRAVCNDRQTSTSVFGRNAQKAVIPELRGERVREPLGKRMNSWWRWRCMLRPITVPSRTLCGALR